MRLSIGSTEAEFYCWKTLQPRQLNVNGGHTVKVWVWPELTGLDERELGPEKDSCWAGGHTLRFS